MKLKSASSTHEVGLGDKIRQGLILASMHLQGRRGLTFSWLDGYVREYNDALRAYGRPKLEASRVLEIGFGARPHRLVWLHNSDINVWGVDLDKPLLELSPKSVFDIVRRNGPERAIKSITRYCISDKHQWRTMASEIGARGRTFLMPKERLIVADAASGDFWAKVGQMDFIYSEDVFEHIPGESLEILVEQMARALRPNGLALIRPMVFTGICGGHQLEWYPHTLDQHIERRTAPWEHLRQNRYPADTYLNRLTRQDYVDIFEKHFHILENKAMKPDRGESFITSAIRAELSRYSDEELFSNSVRFILEPKQNSARQ